MHSTRFAVTRIRTSGILFFALCLLISGVPSCKKDKSENPCKEVTILGGLTKVADRDYTFRTNGGGTIRLELYRGQIIITHDDYELMKIEFWGGLVAGDYKTTSLRHENLKGKHVKDKLLPTRTIIFPDGAKITMTADAMDKAISTISIFDGAQSHRLNFSCGTVIHSSTDPTVATEMDNAEPDGETGSFSIDNAGAKYYNVFMEQRIGNRIMGRVEIGSLVRNNPTQVNDFFDDPRLSHT